MYTTPPLAATIQQLLQKRCPKRSNDAESAAIVRSVISRSGVPLEQRTLIDVLTAKAMPSTS
jgi:hypothetical protein